MNQSEEKKISLSWFFKWFLNNKGAMVLLISLLLFLNVFIFTKIAHLFEPVVAFLTVIMLPIVISSLLYYLLKPFVDFLEYKLRLKRTLAICLVFIVVVALLIWGLAVLVPSIETQLTNFATNLPDYLENIERQITNLLSDRQLSHYNIELQKLINNFSDSVINYAQALSKSAVTWAGDFASTVARVAVAIMISPFILFYLLRDGDRLKYYVSQFLPPKLRVPTRRVMTKVNQQLSSYVQGQVLVSIVVAILFSVMFSIIGLNFGVTLGIAAGFLNLIPYLGSFVAMIPVFILAFVAGPAMVIKCIIVFTIEQTIEGRFVTPLVIGSKLQIHPITILFVLLTAGTLFGVWGVFLAIPIYASVKVVAIEVFDWYKVVSGLYKADFIEENSEDVE
ncbi:AI-2E family transporter [Streptococcus thoraltensis]|uniref:AI-2E family transporter n=1 Tax=Streptococcus thoraltensis TaxID=55085 RepID=UPI00035DD838|nr:AI-2E family transporter [Streptococcus thoraltensis]MDY4760632.1 AI-2E family transporter [Streptococcus thoraltensis]